LFRKMALFPLGVLAVGHHPIAAGECLPATHRLARGHPLSPGPSPARGEGSEDTPAAPPLAPSPGPSPARGEGSEDTPAALPLAPSPRAGEGWGEGTGDFGQLGAAILEVLQYLLQWAIPKGEKRCGHFLDEINFFLKIT
jgi:hypothetical protein